MTGTAWASAVGRNHVLRYLERVAIPSPPAGVSGLWLPCPCHSLAVTPIGAPSVPKTHSSSLSAGDGSALAHPAAGPGVETVNSPPPPLFVCFRKHRVQEHTQLQDNSLSSPQPLPKWVENTAFSSITQLAFKIKEYWCHATLSFITSSFVQKHLAYCNLACFLWGLAPDQLPG